jgi:hypothetical protein
VKVFDLIRPGFAVRVVAGREHRRWILDYTVDIYVAAIITKVHKPLEYK